MTRFGEISPLWHNFKSIWLYLEGFIKNLAKIANSMAQFDAIGQIFIVVNGKNVRQIIKPSGHTVRRLILRGHEFGSQLQNCSISITMPPRAPNSFLKTGKQTNLQFQFLTFQFEQTERSEVVLFTRFTR